MAEASISVDQDQFNCPVCLDLLKDPVTIHCGHSFCMVCINGCWDQNDEKGIYSCPQCRETFTARPVLRRNNMLADIVEKLKKTDPPVSSPSLSYTGPGDVECDFCNEKKDRAIKSCLVCRVSFCKGHLKLHTDVPALKKHKLGKAIAFQEKIQEKICPQHNESVEVYCRTDQRFICYLCTMHEHKGHDTVAAVAERYEKQRQLQEMQRKSQQRIQEKEKKLQELKQAMNTFKRSTQSAVKDTEKIFIELIQSIEKKRSEVTGLIRDQEKAEIKRAEYLLKKLEQEIADLKRRQSELEQLSCTDDHIQFLQNFQSLVVSTGFEDSLSIIVRQHLSFDGVKKSISELKDRLEQFCREPFRKIPSHVAEVQITLPSEPKTREDFLQYFCELTLDPNTVSNFLRLFEKNRAVKWRGSGQSYSDHPERFHSVPQVLCRESMRGRCYWEVEWSSDQWMYIAVSYKGIGRRGQDIECSFGGRNNQSWSLRCSPTLTFCHNNTETAIPGPVSSRVGVYVDHSAGTLSFYSISDIMTLLHRVQTTFTQPLYAGFGVCLDGALRLCGRTESTSRSGLT